MVILYLKTQRSTLIDVSAHVQGIRKIDLQYNNTISISMLESLGNDLFSSYIVFEDTKIYFDRRISTCTRNQEK